MGRADGCVGAPEHALFVSKYLERNAAHATNIAEMVVFMDKDKK